jgi:hypothetical protein
MKRSAVFVGFYSLCFIVIGATMTAVEIASPLMCADVDFTYFGHFSIKIINKLILKYAY